MKTPPTPRAGNKQGGERVKAVFKWGALVGASLCAMLAQSATFNLSYDDAGHLIQMQMPTASSQYQYDAAGNQIGRAHV